MFSLLLLFAVEDLTLDALEKEVESILGGTNLAVPEEEERLLCFGDMVRDRFGLPVVVALLALLLLFSCPCCPEDDDRRGELI